jgi:hypothetical protein
MTAAMAASVRGSMRSRERAKWEPRAQNVRLSPLAHEFDEISPVDILARFERNSMGRTFASPLLSRKMFAPVKPDP